MHAQEALQIVLEKALAHLDRSKESDWAETPLEEQKQMIAKAIDALKNSQPIDKEALKAEFAPIGSLQETAVSNRWGEEYIALAEEFEELIELINR
ncbi:MAG: hypothetical protein LBF86_05760 [Helicobacteraceae bacterium]|jgi:acyl-CoA reductase-like NAD-dependent aldehyde dehydrogenase|nr:hypothetical protein [Helicobacteraceae bacterium]